MVEQKWVGCLEWGGRFLRKIRKVVLPGKAGSPLPAPALRLAEGEARAPRTRPLHRARRPHSAPRAPAQPFRRGSPPRQPVQRLTAPAAIAATPPVNEIPSALIIIYPIDRTLKAIRLHARNARRQPPSAENAWARAAISGHIVCQCFVSEWCMVWVAVASDETTYPLLSCGRQRHRPWWVSPYHDYLKSVQASRPTVNRGRAESLSLTTTSVFPGCSLTFQEHSDI